MKPAETRSPVADARSAGIRQATVSNDANPQKKPHPTRYPVHTEEGKVFRVGVSFFCGFLFFIYIYYINHIFSNKETRRNVVCNRAAGFCGFRHRTGACS